MISMDADHGYSDDTRMPQFETQDAAYRFLQDRLPSYVGATSIDPAVRELISGAASKLCVFGRSDQWAVIKEAERLAALPQKKSEA